MARVAEDLKVSGFIRSAKGEGDDVINVPAFARGDFKRAFGAVAIGSQEVVEALLCRKGFAVRVPRPSIFYSNLLVAITTMKMEIRYGILAIGLAFGTLPLNIFVPIYYNDIPYTSNVFIGLAILFARLFEAFLDPFFGWLSDRWSNKYLTIYALIPYVLGYIAIFNPHPSANPHLWLFMSLFFCIAGFSCASIAYTSWAAEIANDNCSLYSLTSMRETLGLAGLIFAAIVPTISWGSYRFELQHTGYILLLILGIGFALLSNIKNSPTLEANKPFIGDLRAVLKNRIFLKLLIIFLFSGVSAAIPVITFSFFLDAIVQKRDYLGFFIIAYLMASIFGVSIWMNIGKKYDLIYSWILSMIVSILAFLLNLVLEPGQWIIFLFISVITGFANGAELSIPITLVSEIGKLSKNPGVFVGVATMIGKINFGLAAGIGLMMLGAFSFNIRDTKTYFILYDVYVTIPLMLKTVACLLLYRFRKSENKFITKLSA